MTTLVIHAPTSKVVSELKRSFENTLKTCIGDGYALTKSERAQISTGCKVIVIDKDTGKMAEARLVKLEHDSWTKNGIERFNVFMSDIQRVGYRSIALNRRGVALI